MTRKRLNNKWITPQIKELIEAKPNYFQLYKLNIVSHEENKFFKNEVLSKNRKAKQENYQSVFKKYRNETKNTWAIIKALISRGVNKTQIFLSVNSILVSNEIDVANHFNIYFNSIANNLAKSLPPNLNLDPLENITRVPAYMKLFPVSRQECFYHIKSLKKTKNTCKSTVSVELFKFISPYLLDTLCNIFN